MEISTSAKLPTTSFVDTSSFSNTFGGTFVIGNVGNDLFLNYTAVAIPEPTTLLLVGVVGAGLAARRLRRKNVQA